MERVAYMTGRGPWVSVILLLLLLGATGCGSRGLAPQLEPRKYVEGFGLRVLTESLFDGASAEAFNLSVTPGADGSQVAVSVVGARKLKALYFDLAYDPQRYNASSAEATGLLGKETERLTLSVLDRPGKAYFGQVLIHPQDQQGFSGDGVLAVVHFGLGPQAAGRTTSAPPRTAASQTVLYQDGGVLEWSFFNLGDYDQNGEVNLADLTPLSVHFGDSSAPLSQFLVSSAQSPVDGDANSEITLGDITTIAQNFLNSIAGGYNVYQSANLDAYPESPSEYGDPPAIAPLRNVPLAEAQGVAAQQRLRFRTIIGATQVQNAYYWVRPTDGQGDGTPSNPTGGDSTAILQFHVVDPPQTGTGAGNDPYRVSPGNSIDFELYDPLAHVVVPPTYPGVVLFTDEPAAGQFSSGHFNVTGAFHGDFAVFALYHGEPTIPQRICFFSRPDPPQNTPPVAIAHATPTGGAAPLPVTFYAGQSYDPDSGDSIQKVEWDFGDGSGFHTLSNTEYHVYDTTGAYDVALRVTDTHDASTTTSLRITVGASLPSGPTAALTASPDSGDRPLLVTFDASASTAGANPITAYEYDVLGNGGFVPGGSTFAYLYGLAGTYRVTLRVTDSAGSVSSASADVYVARPGGGPAPPHAALAALPNKGNTPLSVNFNLTGSTTGVNMRYVLIPGDGLPRYDPASYPLQVHNYNAVGQKRIAVAMSQTRDTLTGLESLPASAVVALYPPGALCALLNASPVQGAAPLSVSFNGSNSSGGALPYTYDFSFHNNGTWEITGSSSGLAMHTYGAPGVYTARLRVHSSGGGTDDDTVQIRVSAGTGGPTASLIAAPNNGQQPLAVTLDATGTTGGTPPYTFSFDFENDGGWDVTGNLTGSVNHSYAGAGDHTARVRAVDATSQSGEATAVIHVTAVPTIPIAALVANPASGIAPLSTTLDATGTTGGTPPYSFDFDYENDGTWDVTADLSGTVGAIYSNPGSYTARVRITDAASQVATATTAVTALGPLTARLTATPSVGIQPLSVALDARTSGGGTPPYAYNFDYNDDGIWEVTNNTTGQASHNYLVGSYAARVRVADSSSPPAFSDATVNIRSVAVLSANLVASPIQGKVPPNLTVNFNALGTTGGMPPLTYDFDFDGDSTWDITGNLTGLSSYNYARPNFYTAWVRVRDSLPGSPQTSLAPAQVTITRNPNPPAPHGWYVYTVAQIIGDLSSYTGLTIVNGNPAVSFFDADMFIPGKQGLYYSRATDAQGTLWPAPPTQVAGGNHGLHSSIKLVQGRPAIAYYDQFNGDLRYVRAGDAVGVDWVSLQSIHAVPDTPNCGSWCSMDFVVDVSASQTLPGISYIADIGDYPFEILYHGAQVRYVRATDVAGAGWAGPQLIDISPDPQVRFACTSLERLDPTSYSPAVSYVQEAVAAPNNWLKYSIAVDDKGDTWSRPGFPLAVEASVPGPGTSLEMFLGLPWVSWSFGNGQSLHLVKSTTASGSAWLIPGYQPDAGKVGDWSSSEIVGPVLGTSYVDYGAGPLKYVEMSQTTPPLWLPPELVDITGFAWGTYLIEVNGFPAISYYDRDIEGDWVRFAVFQ